MAHTNPGTGTGTGTGTPVGLTGPGPVLSLDLPADPRSVGAARRLVVQALGALGLADAAEGAELAVSELVANAVLHARTQITVRVLRTDAGARVEVEDGSAVLPVPGLLAATATSGRGLVLVGTLCPGWGVEPVPGHGKVVWFPVSAAVPAHDGGRVGQELTAEDVLAAWAGADDPSADLREVGERVDVVLRDVPVAALLSAKMHVEDLVRELKLILLNDATRVTERPGAVEEVRLARRTDSAVEEFSEGRAALRTATVRAAARGQAVATIVLDLPVRAAPAARRYREALEEADELCRTGRLLVAESLSEHADLRRWYLGEIIDQLEADR